MKVNEVDVVQIPSLPELMALPAGGGDVPIYNGADNILYRIKAALLGGGSETAVKWNVSTTYAADVVVEFGLKLWLSLADGNTGNTPVDGSAWWIEVSKSTANGFGYWSAGVYTIDPSMVLRSGGLFYIDNQVVTFPFNSVDFEAEYAQNKWVQVAGSDAGTIDSSGFNGNLTTSDDTVQKVAQKFDDYVNDRGYALSDVASSIVVGSKLVETITRAFTLTDVKASLGIASSGTLLFTINIKKNGTSIFSTKLTFDHNETTTVTASTPFVFTSPTISFAVGDVMEILVDQVGMVSAGKGLIIFLTIDHQ